MDIWVVVEGDSHGIKEGSREVLTAAAGVAGGTLVAAIVLSSDREYNVKEVVEFGPESIYYPDEWIGNISGRDLVEFLGTIIERERPGLVLAAQTIFGRELLETTSLKYNLPFFPDCIGVSLEQGEGPILERLCYGGRISSFVSASSEYPTLATWREGLVNVKKRSGRSSKIIPLPLVRETVNLIRFVEEIKADPKVVDLSEAEVIISGGGGMGPEGFQLIHELADLIGAAVGGSRVARDNGWIPLTRQIGQTGKSVNPKLIISCGISGATQHTFGMREAKTVIAINKDKNAPIFKIADTGIVGDVHEVLPDLIKRIKGGR